MNFIDTHTHIYLPEFDTDRDDAIIRAKDKGISKMLMPNIDIQSTEAMLAVETNNPGYCHSMIGLHPTSVKKDYQYQLDILFDLALGQKFIAIGEIGIDLYWDKTWLKEQMTALKGQIEFALAHKLPVVIHSRESFPEVFSVLDEFRGENLKGVFHAFSGGIKEAEKAISIGFMLGIGGVVTFKNSGLDIVLKEIGPENIIFETDSPYLAPVPYRGKRNESSYICIINSRLSTLFEKPEEEIAALAYNNSIRLFNF